MRRFSGACAVALLVASASTGCAGEQEALIVLHAVAAESNDQGGCTFDAGNGVELVRGLLDVQGGTSYLLAPVLFNQLPSQGQNATNSGIDDSEVQLLSVDVSLSLPSDIADQLSGDVSLSHSPPLATNSISPGEQFSAVIEVVPADLTQELAGILTPDDDVTIVADIVYHAARTGNTRGSVGMIDSRNYSFPIQLCVGCLATSCAGCPTGSCEVDFDPFARLCGNVQDGGTPPEAVCEAIMGSSTGGVGGDESSSGGSPMGTTGG